MKMKGGTDRLIDGVESSFTGIQFAQLILLH